MEMVGCDCDTEREEDYKEEEKGVRRRKEMGEK